MVVKRFLAGAQCPACGLVDKLVLYRQDEREHVECVRCGYHQIEGGELVSAPEPQAPAAPDPQAPQPLRFYPKAPQ